MKFWQKVINLFTSVFIFLHSDPNALQEFLRSNSQVGGSFTYFQ